MATSSGACPLTQRELIEGFFIEHRAQIIDIAAYLDRLDRSVDHDAESDFRFLAVRKAMRELSSDEPGRVERILMHLSDPVVELMDTRDRQNAFGAFPGSEKQS
jgi:hypothetical protein